MKLKAKDTLFISSVSSENILPGQQFEVSDAEGKRLIDRGLATKMSSPPRNKMAKPSANKSATGARKGR